MKLSFFTMPIHPLGKPISKSLAEDREAFLLADKLGYAEAYCGEHSTDLAEIITSTVAFLASLAYETKNIRLGTGTVNLPNSHPARGWQPISGNFLLPKWAATHWPNYVEGCKSAGLKASYDDWRVAKNICVAKDAKTARRYARDEGSPYVLYYSQLLTKMRAGGRLNLFKEDQNMPDDEVTLDYVLDRLVIHGDPASVADQILALREETGPFRHIVYAGHDWTDYDLGRESMILMAEKVLPTLQEVTKSEKDPD